MLATLRAISASLFLGIFGFVLLAVASAGCNRYDVLVEKDQTCQQRWADVEAQLQRRADLVPNLVATVKGAAAHEEDTLKAVTQARAEATGITIRPEDLDDPAKMKQYADAQDKLRGALSRLLVVNEQYPQLRANQAYHDLQVELEATENRILRAREQYNASVADFNSELQKIHGQVVNRITGRPFKARPYFSATPESQAVPKVAF